MQIFSKIGGLNFFSPFLIMEDLHAHRAHTGIFLLVVLIAGGFYLVGKYLEQQDFSPVMISVQGEGKVMANPDIAQISFGVETGRQPTAEEAMQVLSDSMNAVFAAVKEAGVEEKDITTQSLNLNPAYDWNEGERIDRGFEARQSLRVKIRDLQKISTVLSAATVAGANQAGGVSFTIDDPEELRVQARAEAIENAEEKAHTLAVELGKNLGKLRGFSEGVGASPYPVARMDMALGKGGVGGGGTIETPIPAGEQEVQVFVTVMYELK